MRHREQERLQLSQEHDPMSSMSSSATTSITPHSIQVPSEIVRKWQEVVDVLAEIMHVPSASIMRVEPPHIKVFVSSTSKGNPCEPGALDTGPYCETVLKTGQPLLIPNALENEAWKANPHVRLGMISYLGVPIGWPDGRIFGTICVRDNKRNEYSEAYLKLLLHFRDMLQADLKSLARLHGEIEEREAKIRRLVDANIIGIFAWDVEGRILEANDAFLHMVGYDRGDLASGRMRWTDLTPAEWRERDERARAELSSTGTVQSYEKEYFRKDGGRVPVLIGGALFEQSGSEGVAFVLDLTERNRAEGALRESEYKLRKIIETVPSFLWSTDPAGEPTQLSQRMLDYSGMQFEDFLHGGWEAFIHPDDFPETARAFYQAIQTGTSYQAVNRLRRADGEFRWHQTRGEPLRDREGQIVQWYGLSVDIDEHKKAEERLRRSESYLAEAQRLSHTGTWVLDARAMRYLHWSDEAYRIWGFDPLQGPPSRENMWQRIHPDDRDRVWEEVQEALRQKRDFSSEFRILLPDGTIKYLEAATYHEFSSSGALAGAVSTHIDVTGRKRTEEALRESEAKIQRLVDSNIIGIMIWDFDGRILEANDEFLRMVGYDRDDLLSGRIWWTDLTPPDWRDRNNTRIEQQKSSGRFEPFEKEYTRKDGSRVPVLIGGATFEEGGNQGVAFVLDLAERKRAEQALMRSEAYLAETQKLTHTGSWAWDARSQKVLYCSEEMFRIFGLDPQEHLPTRKNFRQRVHPEDRDRVDEGFARVVNERVDSFDEYRIVLPDGTVKHVNSSGHPVLDGNGELIEFVGTATDVTERKRAEEALRESEAKFSDFAATASDWLWEIGTDYKFTLLTENAFRSNPADRIGTLCWEHALDLETEPEKWRLVWATLDSRKPFHNFVYCSVDGTGSPMYVKVSGKPVFDTNGEFRGYRGTGTDVTAIIRAQRAEASLRTVEAEARESEQRYREVQQELAHANRVATMGQLTSSIAHEVNQPITAAVTNAQ